MLGDKKAKAQVIEAGIKKHNKPDGKRVTSSHKTAQQSLADV